MAIPDSAPKKRLDLESVVGLLAQFGVTVDDNFKEQIQLSMGRAEMRENSGTKAKENEVYVYGPILSGVSGWLARYLNLVSVPETVQRIRSIKAKGLTPQLYIDSPGGTYFGGVSIASAVTDTEANTKMDGLAASAASVIFMAGAKRTAAKGSQMMVHRPRGYSGGNADDLAADGAALRNIEEDHIENIVELSSLSAEEAKNAVYATTWYRVKDMQKLGFLSETETPTEQAQESAEQTTANANQLAVMNARLALAKSDLRLHKE